MGNPPYIPDEAGIAMPQQKPDTLPTQNVPTYTHVMIAPDGSKADVPADKVNDAFSNGAKMGFEMVGPDGSEAVVPLEQVHYALSQGARPKGAIATGNAMQTSGAPGQVRTATSFLPAAGATAGGIGGSPGVVTGAVGAGLGAGLGREGEQVLNHYLLGDDVPSTVGKEFKNVGGQVALGAGADLGAQALGPVAKGAANLLRGPAPDVESQLTKDLIRQALGSKADADIVANAATRIGKTKAFSTVENELKLVKPQVDAELATQNKALDNVLANSKAQVPNARHEVNQVFDDMIQQTRNSMATQTDKNAMIKSINEVRYSVTGKLQNQATGVQALNDAKRLIGEQVKKFAPPEMLNTGQKAEQEAYRQGYFKLRDMVSAAEPQSATLNQQISRNINLQELLEKKFNTLDTSKAAKDSYDATVLAGKRKATKEVSKKVATDAGLGVAGYGLYETGKKIGDLAK